MATTRYLPAEILNLIAAQIPQEVYVLLCIWQSSELHNNELEQTSLIGTFSTLQLANDAGTEFMDQKIEEVECTERVILRDCQEPETRWSYNYDNWTNDDGMKSWSIEADHSKQYFLLHVMRQKLVRNGEWDSREIGLPSNDLEHGEDCQCRDNETKGCSTEMNGNDDEISDEGDEEIEDGEPEDAEAEEAGAAEDEEMKK